MISKALTAAAASGALFAPMIEVSAAEQVVLETNAAAFAPGQTMDAAAGVMLAAGEFVVIATDDGKLIRIEGPHTGPATTGSSPNDNAVRRALAQLVSSGRPQVGGVGAVRGTAESAAVDTRSDAWALHAERNGDQCAIDGRPTLLWREDVAMGVTAQLTDAANDRAGSVEWAAAVHTAPWPEDVARTENRIYFVRPGESLRSIAIRLHLLPAEAVANPLAAAAWLAARGCTDQARIVLR